MLGGYRYESFEVLLSVFPKEEFIMFGFGNNNKDIEEYHILPKDLRQGENDIVSNVIGFLGVVVAIGGGIISIFNGANMADKAIYNIRKNNDK